jgi:hypothetical protein
MIHPTSLPLFVATRLTDVPPGLTRYVTVDGSVPGAMERWDHHITGEPTNLDALPATVDPSSYDGVGTTSADADSVISAALVLLGGRSAVPLRDYAALESAAHWCDHLVAHPGVDPEGNARGRGLQYAIARTLSGRDGAPLAECTESARFSAAVQELVRALASGSDLPFYAGWLGEDAEAQLLDEAGHIARVGDVALVDLRGREPLAPGAVYRRHACPVQVTLDEHPKGGRRYVVGVHPGEPALADVRPALAALGAVEFSHGAPCLAPEPVPGSENWGGRQRVFGSPWNYGSRIVPSDVVVIVAKALGLHGAEPPTRFDDLQAHS